MHTKKLDEALSLLMDLSLQTVRLGSLKAKTLVFHFTAIKHIFSLYN